MRRPARARYSADEVEALVEGYEELTYQRDTTRRGQRVVHGLIDVRRAIPLLDPPLLEAVMLFGVAGFGATEASRRTGVSVSTVYRRYQRGLEQLARILNGGSH